MFAWVRTPGGFGGEGSSRTPDAGESATEKEKRNTYFVPIERLNCEKELFAKLQSLRYSFAAYFGEAAIEPFISMWSVHTNISSSASTLIQYAEDDERPFAEPLLNRLGWGAGPRPDDIDRTIEKAVIDIEAVCRPVLTGTPTK